MVYHPYETKFDSFYFVNNKLIMHNKAEHAYTAWRKTFYYILIIFNKTVHFTTVLKFKIAQNVEHASRIISALNISFNSLMFQFIFIPNLYINIFVSAEILFFAVKSYINSNKQYSLVLFFSCEFKLAISFCVDHAFHKISDIFKNFLSNLTQIWTWFI